MGRRQRTLTARRTTTVTEEVTATETTDDTLPGAVFAPGWLDVLPDEAGWKQRQEQVFRCLDLLWLHAASGSENPPIADAVTVLRAGPGATPLELEHGRTA